MPWWDVEHWLSDCPSDCSVTQFWVNCFYTFNEVHNPKRTILARVSKSFVPMFRTWTQEVEGHSGNPAVWGKQRPPTHCHRHTAVCPTKAQPVPLQFTLNLIQCATNPMFKKKREKNLRQVHVFSQCYISPPKHETWAAHMDRKTSDWCLILMLGGSESQVDFWVIFL